jgi:hypothetical protein
VIGGSTHTPGFLTGSLPPRTTPKPVTGSPGKRCYGPGGTRAYSPRRTGIVNVYPAQIAWTSQAGRTMYDFRTRKFRPNMQEWRRPDDLGPPETQAFLGLVHSWERMVLAMDD